jgi:hypothetical protein
MKPKWMNNREYAQITNRASAEYYLENGPPPEDHYRSVIVFVCKHTNVIECSYEDPERMLRIQSVKERAVDILCPKCRAKKSSTRS